MRKRIDNTVCHCLKMRRSAENVIRFYDDMLSPTGITVRQYSLLNKISEHDGCNVRELAEATELDRSTLARSLKPLMSRGLVLDSKEAGARDSRLSLSEIGQQICDEAGQLWMKAQKEFEDKVGMKNVQALEEILESMQTLE